jgi:hypothetical protein
MSSLFIACMLISTVKYHGDRLVGPLSTWVPELCNETLVVTDGPLTVGGATMSSVDAVLWGTELGRDGSRINRKVLAGLSRFAAAQLGECTEVADGLHVRGAVSDQADFIIKADDDTYMHPANVRALLDRYDPERVLHIGRAGQVAGVDYCSGGAGYLLSRAALLAVDWTTCRHTPQGEDVSVGACLPDETERHWHHGFYHKPPSFFLATVQGKRDHPDGLVNDPLSFHSMTPADMRNVHYAFGPRNNPVYGRRGDEGSEPWPDSTPTH